MGAVAAELYSTTVQIRANTKGTSQDWTFNADGSLTLPTNGTISGLKDLTVTGNLVVVGSSVYANTETVLIKDNIITLNAAISQSGSPISNAGIEIDRGASANAYLIWDETGDRWVYSSDGTTYYGIADAGRLDSAFTQANTANTNAINSGTYANAAFDKANSSNVIAQSAFDKANSANVLAQAAYDTANNAGGAVVANTVILGTPTDGSLTNVGAYTAWTTSTYVTDAIDDLNEMVDNVRANTFVKSVTFTASPAAAGSGSTITLTLVPVTANGTIRYDINWGDASFSNNATGLTQTHVYTAQGSKTITVRAYNTSGAGTGSEASNTSAGIVVIYTADPTMGYSFYRSLSGGTALVAGSTMYVTEGETFYLQNDTTNTTGSAVTYIANFGDGVANTAIASDTAAGGVFGARLPYSYGFTKSSGTSSNTINLVLTSSNTANPSAIPRSISTVSMKIYDANIASPANLSSKTITFTGTSGTSPNLCYGFANNTGGAVTITSGNSVSRTAATSGNIATLTMTTIAYHANSGTLSAYVNGVDSGSKILSTANNVSTNSSLAIATESDYQLFDSTGTTTTFALSTYAPGLFRGITANVSTLATSIPLGVNNYQLRHSANGNTNIVEFVKDDVTGVPVTTAGTLNTVTGNYRYISGIPYFTTSSTISMSGATVNNWIGQTYTSTTTPIQVVAGTTAEGTGPVITNTNFTYTQANGASSYLTTVNNVAVPNANTGKLTAYTLGTLTTIPISASTRAVQQVGIRANNVNGTGTTVENATKLAVHSASQSGISEIAVTVSGITGTYTDNGIRSASFLAATANTPAYSNATNFYTTTTYSEASDPGVAGTKEATIRLGTLRYDANNYSTGYLPVGPNRSADTGIQYFTFAWRRTGVSSFDINLTSTTGVSGCWIALPGTEIDYSSGLNGWLRCDTTKAGAGFPGSLNTGNGNDGCASTDADRIIAGTALSGGYTMSFGTRNSSSAGSTGNVILVRIALSSGQNVTALSIGAAA
jgi:hypothetical protein